MPNTFYTSEARTEISQACPAINHDPIPTQVDALIEECLRNPFEGTGKPEPLRGDLAGFRSRRIDREHRLVYRVMPSALRIVQCRYHYRGRPQLHRP